MRSVTPMKVAKIGYLAVSAVMCALGVLLIVKPGLSLNLIAILFGITMVVFGIVKIVGYFSKDLFRLAFQYDLTSGILMLVLGVVLLVNPADVLAFFCTVLGILVLADGLFKIQISFDAKTFGITYWWLILVSALCAGVFGLLLLLRPLDSAAAMTVLLGVSMVFEAAMNFCTVLTAVKIIRHQRPDVIDSDNGKD